MGLWFMCVCVCVCLCESVVKQAKQASKRRVIWFHPLSKIFWIFIVFFFVVLAPMMIMMMVLVLEYPPSSSPNKSAVCYTDRQSTFHAAGAVITVSQCLVAISKSTISRSIPCSFILASFLACT